jgi:hypothetical protein
LFWWLFLMWFAIFKKSLGFWVQFSTTMCTHKDPQKKLVCVFWNQTLVHMIEYSTSQQGIFYHITKVNPHGMTIFVEYLMMWHVICYKDSLLITWACSPARCSLFNACLLMSLEERIGARKPNLHVVSMFWIKFNQWKNI